MRLDNNSSKIKSGSFKRSSNYPSKWIVIGRGWYGLRAIYRKFRTSKLMTVMLGPQYTRSRDFIEIDITYFCNMHCLNCNRSSSQAPEAKHISLEKIKTFIEGSISRSYRWNRVRILGGEPTLHPQFSEIIEQLLRYKKWNPECLIEVVTNGYGKKVQRVLETLPKSIWIENSRKLTNVQEDFGPFNLAPCDDPDFLHADYKNGCEIMEECGMGLTPMGYYPCAIAGGIDRIAGWNIGYESFPDLEDDMLELAERFCALCGRYKAGHFIPRNLRPKLLESKISVSWVRLYEDWSQAMQSEGRNDCNH